MEYAKTNSTSYYIGLPDVPLLSDKELSPEQLELLKLAVAAGVYTPSVTAKAPSLNKLNKPTDLIKD
jgi:hypothetical protein